MRVIKKEGLERIRIISHNKKVFYAIILLSISLVFILILINILKNDKEINGANKIGGDFCLKDEDCIIQKTGCCACNMGGEERCMNLTQSTQIKDKLSKSCINRTICSAVNTCKESKCSCIKNKCG